TAILPQDQGECPRCYTHRYVRRRTILQWTMEKLVTSILLYIQANMMPIMITEILGNHMISTIMAGVIFILSEGSYPVALV
ncbi:paraquat-inducible membrane protein A, partial [Yersinia pestis]|uniref:paraquat-inducible protein A n=1 Tax=Yersinia pestis TaxID=632 RepID=UPI001C4836C2